MDDSCAAVQAAMSCSGPRNGAQFLKVAAHPSVYEKTMRPPCGNETHQGPTLVEVQFKLMTVNGVDEKLGHVTLNGYFRTWWKDPRLAFNSTASGGCFDSIDLSGDVGEQIIWVPDLYIDNLVKLEKSTAKLTSISPDGSVWSSSQNLVTIKADFDLSRLPYDKHVVDLIVASYSQPTTNLRMIPRRGVLGQAVTGVGLIAPNVRHKVWAFTGSESPDVYTTPGHVRTTTEPWDYVHLRMQFERKPKYYIDQAIYPAVVFAMISYSQFWVDATSAPARATLAVIPVLIMRTMFSSVYSSVPQGSQHMWLSDFLFTVNLMVAIAAVEFAIVQYLCQIEKRRAAKLQGLSRVRSTAEHLFDESARHGMSLLDFLNCRYLSKSRSNFGSASRHLSISCAVNEAPERFKTKTDPAKAQDVSEDTTVVEEVFSQAAVELPGTVEPTNGAYVSEQHKTQDMVRGLSQALSATPAGIEVKEVDFLFIQFAKDVFSRMPGSKENRISVAEFRRCLRTFNIYMHFLHASSVMGMFLRDHGEETPDDEAAITFTFAHFTKLLLVIDQYSLDNSGYSPWSVAAVVYFFQSRSPSRIVDTISRIIFPIAYILQAILFYALLDTWKLEPIMYYS